MPVLTPTQLSPDQKAKRIRRCRRRRPYQSLQSSLQQCLTLERMEQDAIHLVTTPTYRSPDRIKPKGSASPNPNALYAPAQRTIPKPSNRLLQVCKEQDTPLAATRDDGTETAGDPHQKQIHAVQYTAQIRRNYSRRTAKYGETAGLPQTIRRMSAKYSEVTGLGIREA